MQTTEPSNELNIKIDKQFEILNTASRSFTLEKGDYLAEPVLDKIGIYDLSLIVNGVPDFICRVGIQLEPNAATIS